MFYHRSKSPNLGESENPFLLSFSDLMAGLLAIFILVLIVTLIELERRREELRLSKEELIESLEGIQKLQDNVAKSLGGLSHKENSLAIMLDGIQRDLQKQGIKVVIAENARVLRIPEQELQFPIGGYRIPATYTHSANRIGHKLLKELQKPEFRSLLDTVFVEGHTDSIPNYREMGNWGLSAHRAISLWKFWTEDPGEVAGLKALLTKPSDSSQAPKPLISVSGYADTRSTHGILDGQGIPNDRPEDRRIDLRFTISSSEKEDLIGLQEKLTLMKNKTSQLIQELKASDNAK
jgi:flagellar motor protein MotB